MTPYEALQRAMFYVSGLCSQRTLNKPGAVIERLTPETRDALKDLKSDEIGPDAMGLHTNYYVDTRELAKEKEYVQDRLDFDKKF